MANGQPPKWFSDKTLQTQARIEEMRRAGASDREIEEFLVSAGAERVNEREGLGGAVSNYYRGLATGLSEAGTSTVGALGFLSRPIGGRALEDWAERSAEENARFYDPMGTSGAVGRGLGRVGGELALAMATAAPVAKLVGKVPGVGSAVTRALESGSRLQRAAGVAATGAPIDIVQGVKSDRPLFLPESTGRIGSVLENVGLSGLAGAIMPPARPNRLGLPAPVQPRQLPAPTGRLMLPAPATSAVEEAIPTTRTFYGQPEGPPGVAAPRTFYGQPEGPPSVAAPRTFYGQPEGPPSLARPGEEIIPPPAVVAEEVVPPSAAAGRMETPEARDEVAAILESLSPAKRKQFQERIDAIKATQASLNKSPGIGQDAVTPAVTEPSRVKFPEIKRGGGWPIQAVRDAKTGEPFAGRMLRGEGGTAAQGSTGDMALLGPARYTTPDEGYARFFAEDAEGKMVGGVRDLDVFIERPLVIDSDKQWRELTKRAGWFSPNPTGLPPDEIKRYTGALRSIIEGDGYDGVIVRIPRDYSGSGIMAKMGEIDERYGKTLDRVFGADQVIEFKPRGGRPGFAQTQALTTLGGGGLGALAGGLTGEDRETAISGIIAGGLAGAGLGYAAGGRLARPTAPGVRGSTPDIQAVNETIRVGDRPSNTTPWLSGFDRFLTNYVAQTIPMERAGRVAAGKAGERAVSEAIAQAQGAGQMAKQYFLDNISPTLTAARGKWDDVRALLKARRDLDIRLKGGAEKSDVPTDVLERAIASAEADPAVKNAADVINTTYRDLLTRRYQAGIISTEAYNRILNSEDFYTPFVREFVQERNAIGGTGGKRWTISSTGVRRMDRMQQASAQTADPLEVLAASVERTFNDVGRQNVQNVLATFADLDKIPGLIRPVTGKVGPDALTFTQMRGGRPQQYEVLDKDLYDAIAGQSQTSANLLVLIGSYFKKALQTGVTITPDFMQANVIRDLSLSGIQRPDVQRAVREMVAGSAAGGATGAASAEEGERMKGFLRGAGMGVAAGAYARPLGQTMVAMKNIVRNDDVYRNWLRQGGSTEGFYVRNVGDARQFLERMERDGTIKDIINPRRWVDALMYIGSVGEQSTRLAAYKQMKDIGLSDAGAILESQDRTLRFAQRGRQTGGIAETAAFWNPRVQGWNKLARMLRDPKTWGMGAAMITAPTVALWNQNKDNPEYWERPVWERNIFWLVPKNGEPDEYGKRGFWRIPKPFEIGILFASIPERLLDAASQSGVDIPLLDTGRTAAPQVAEPGRAVEETLGTVAKETAFGLLPIPTAVSVPGQLYINRDLFRGRPIVSRTDLPETEQITPESSALARTLADRGIAPQKTDFAVRGLFGGAGSFASERIDALARAAGGAAPEPRPSQGGVGTFIANRFQTRTYSATDTEVAARDRLRDLREVNNGLRKVEMSNNPEQIDRYIQRNQANLDAYYSLSGAQNALDQLAADRRAVIADQRISRDERAKILTQIRNEADRIGRDVLAYGMPR